jgi:hypothetical protein
LMTSSTLGVAAGQIDLLMVPSGGSLLYELMRGAGSGWGMGGSQGVLPYLRRVVPQNAMRPPKKCSALSLTPSPEGPHQPRSACG